MLDVLVDMSHLQLIFCPHRSLLHVTGMHVDFVYIDSQFE